MIARALAVAAALAAAASPAAAERGARDAARRLAAAAQVHYDLGEYDEAVAAYREAYRLHPSPGLLYNLGQAYRLGGDCQRAATMYRNYLRLAPRSPYRGLVEEHLDHLAPCEQARAAAPLGRRAAIGPEVAPAPPWAGAGAPGRTRRAAGLAVSGGGALLGVAGMYFAMDAARVSREVSARHDQGTRWEELASLDAQGRRSGWIGTSLLVAGGAAIATGATLYVLGWRADERARVSLQPGRGGASVTVAWGF